MDYHSNMNNVELLAEYKLQQKQGACYVFRHVTGALFFTANKWREDEAKDWKRKDYKFAALHIAIRDLETVIQAEQQPVIATHEMTLEEFQSEMWMWALLDRQHQRENMGESMTGIELYR